jgi:polyisoprenoid-binding protein YceI
MESAVKTNLSFAYPTLAVILPVAVFLGFRQQPPEPASPDRVAAVMPAPLERELRLVVAEDGNEVRYRVREQLARIEFPSDAVGATTAVTGALVIADDGSVVRDASRFVVDLTGLKSDSDRRDGYIQRRTLETETYPNVEFAPTAITGLATPPQSMGDLTLTVVGDMTIHGTTRARRRRRSRSRTSV